MLARRAAQVRAHRGYTHACTAQCILMHVYSCMHCPMCTRMGIHRAVHALGGQAAAVCGSGCNPMVSRCRVTALGIRDRKLCVAYSVCSPAAPRRCVRIAVGVVAYVQCMCTVGHIHEYTLGKQTRRDAYGPHIHIRTAYAPHSHTALTHRTYNNAYALHCRARSCTLSMSTVGSTADAAPPSACRLGVGVEG